jgi:hypothetical protein
VSRPHARRLVRSPWPEELVDESVSKVTATVKSTSVAYLTASFDCQQIRQPTAIAALALERRFTAARLGLTSRRRALEAETGA